MSVLPIAASSACGSVAPICCIQDNQECVVVFSLRPSTLTNNFKSMLPTMNKKLAENMFDDVKPRTLL
jgi:hypothetical protein